MAYLENLERLAGALRRRVVLRACGRSGLDTHPSFVVLICNPPRKPRHADPRRRMRSASTRR